MTIVKPSIKSSVYGKKNLQKSNKKDDDIFSKSNVEASEYSSDIIDEPSNDEAQSSQPCGHSKKKNDLQDLFSEIQNRMKRRTLNQKRKMESELKSTISRTVDEMSKKIEAIKTEVDIKLNGVKLELDKLHNEREQQINQIKFEYEDFKEKMRMTMEKIDFGERRVHEIRAKFIDEMKKFNQEFNLPRAKIEELFDAAVERKKKKFVRKIF